MVMAIEESVKRFRAKVRAGIRADLKNYFSSPQVIDRSSDDRIEIAVPGLRIPRFRHAMADPFSNSDSDDEPLKEKHPVSLDDLMDIAAEELNLKKIIPEKVVRTLSSERGYGALADKGPEAMRSFRRTFQRALMRQIASGSYHPGEIVYVRGHDKRYNVPETTEVVSKKALVINIKTPVIDTEDLERIMTFNTWTNLWLKRFYDEVVTEYVVHRDLARVVNKKEYLKAKGESKTKVSSAYVKCLDLMLSKYSPDIWNIYIFQFADGRIQSGNEGEALSLLDRWVIPNVNLFCYGQVMESDESHFYKKLLVQTFGRSGKVRSFDFQRRQHVYPAMGICFG
ncbi:MAG TPA: DUF444 family protein [Candidatus Nanoarchaeia archaeon]|nr:DUF444 family protein [Candidatus Nanoarchaeia archaeon]